MPLTAPRDYRVYVGDILSAIERIRTYTAGGREEFLASPLIQDGVIRQLQIIGEAAVGSG